jgi:ribonucleoside-diphosphate reductase alpha chain
MKKNIVLKKVIKVGGSKEDFDSQKIIESIHFATGAAKEEKETKKLASLLGKQVVESLRESYPNGEAIPTSEIGEAVEKVLIENGHAKTAKTFIRYRENKKHLHQKKETLGFEDDIGLSYNTLFILKERFLKRDEDGKILETPKEMIERVARFLSEVEKGQEDKEKWHKAFLEIMSDFKFTPGTRVLANAGKRTPQLANCFVWGLEDDIDKIFEILHKSTLIKKHGGGCGYNFSKIRPEGDLVAGIPGLAGGPVKMMEMFDLMTNLFRQEGKYESGNMAILNADHPDIFNFISSKKNDGYLSKTNISVGITDEFMKAAIGGKDWDLINPRTGKVVNTVKANSILNLMASMAWQTGDPGIINLSAINKGTKLANPLLKKRGPIMATNVCGEIPLYPYESCNLGYINFTKFVKDKKFDFRELRKVMRVAVRFMDNVIEASWFPVKEITESVRNHRRIGIGCVGWAETLCLLEIPYDSPRAFTLAEKITKTMYQAAFDTSCDLAEEKGPFPLIRDSIWANRKRKPRNVAFITFPPSSSNAVICETSYGIEPYFALAYEQNVMDGTRLKTITPLFVRKLMERGIYSDKLIQKVIDNHGSAQGIKEIPADLKRIFKVAHDINWKDHIKMQAAFQKWTDNAITKTINMPSSSTAKEVEEAFILAWKLGCKGLTIYRDKTKDNQVFNFGGDGNVKLTKMCPTCNIKLVKDKNCYKCKKCGFSTCEL